MCGGWYWNGTCLRMLCVVGISICTPVGIRKAFACMCMGGWYFVCSMPNYLRARWYTQNRQSIKVATRAAFRTSQSGKKRAARRASYIADHDKRPCNFKTSNHMKECENLAFMHFHTSTRVWTWYTLFPRLSCPCSYSS